MEVNSITPAELRAELESESPPKLLDVREDFELRLGMLKNDFHIPIGSLAERVGELSPADDLVIYCRSGIRSAHATLFLGGLGFPRVRNLDTGFNGWAETVDPTLTPY